MTLAELIPAIQHLPPTDKLKLIRVLAEELDGGEDISPLVPHKVYCLPLPTTPWKQAVPCQTRWYNPIGIAADTDAIQVFHHRPVARRTRSIRWQCEAISL